MIILNNEIFKKSALITALLLTLPVAGPDDSVWVQLFNGQDLDDWFFHFRGSDFNIIPKNAVYVEDGILKSEQSPYPFGETSFGHFSYRDESFSHYLLRIEYMFINQAAEGRDHWNFNNSGVMVHSETMEDLNARNGAFPNSLEAQFLGDLNCQNNPEEAYCCLDGGDNPCRDASHEGSVSQPGEGITMNLCTPGTYVTYNDQETGAHCITAEHATVFDNEWVEVSLHVFGDSLVEFYVRDSKVFEFTSPKLGGVPGDDGPLLSEGVIALQSESADIHFRTVELLNFVGCMDETASNFKNYHRVENNSLCEYEISVHPDPVESGILIGPDAVQFSGEGDHSVNIHNLKGELVFSRNGTGKMNYNPGGHLNPGIYFISVTNAGVTYNKKVTKL